MRKPQLWTDRTQQFCATLSLRIPILLAPMAGACPVSLSSAVANKGGLGACGVLLMQPDDIIKWAAEFRSQSNGAIQMNNWIPDPSPMRDEDQERKIQNFIAGWHTESESARPVPELPDFDAQYEAMLAAQPAAISSIMGIYPEEFVNRMNSAGIQWLATATTVDEAKEAVDAGADAIVAQGFEAGGHRGTFAAGEARRAAAGLVSLLPAIVDTVDVPVVAAGGIADGRGIAAAITLGASAVQIGTGFLRTPEAGIPSAWADAIQTGFPNRTVLTRAFTGRLGRSIATEYAEAAESADAPEPAPYPVQRQLTGNMVAQARRENDVARMQAWAGQSGFLSSAVPAGQLIGDLWKHAQQLLP